MWTMTLLWSMTRVRVWNSTPMVALEPRLNSLRAKRARMRERQRAVGGRGPRAGDARPSEGAAAGVGRRRLAEASGGDREATEREIRRPSTLSNHKFGC